MTLVRERDGEIDEAAEVERGVPHRSVLTGLHAFPESADRFFERERARIRSGQHGLHADLLFGVVQKLGHTLRALDQGKRLFRLAFPAVRQCEIAQPRELISGRESLLQAF